MLEKLLKMANSLDSRGFTKEADMVDEIMQKVAEMGISGELDSEGLDLEGLGGDEGLGAEEDISFKEIEDSDIEGIDIADEESMMYDELDEDSMDDNIYIIIQGETEPLSSEYFYSREDAEEHAKMSLGDEKYSVVELQSSSDYLEDEESLDDLEGGLD